MQSLKAIDLIIEYLPKALERSSVESLEMLSTASTLAAMAFSNASLGLDHALAHSLGGKLDLAHGLIHPVLLPGVMRFNMPACRSKMAAIGEIVLGRRPGRFVHRLPVDAPEQSRRWLPFLTGRPAG